MYLPETGHSEDVIRLRGEQTSGSEHDVWMDDESGLVYKVPNNFGMVWQKMHPGFAERDQYVMQQKSVNKSPQGVRGFPLVQNGGNTCERKKYCALQISLGKPDPTASQRCHQLTFADLQHYIDMQRQLYEFFLQGQEIREEDNLGFDMLGGQIVTMVPSVINPFENQINPRISNLLVADTDIIAKADLPEAGVKKGDLISKKGEIKQCDLRMYDFDRRGVRGRLIKAILEKLQDAQDTAISSLLTSFNLRTKFDAEKTRVRRMVKTLFERALPKMRAYAEAMGPQFNPQTA